MRRLVSLIAVTMLLLTLSPMGSTPASAAVGRQRIVFCPDSCWPTAFTFSPNGKTIWYTERFSGEIRTHNIATGRNRLWATIGNLSTSGREQGLFGIALDHRWPDIKWVYVYFTQQSPFKSRIIRLRKQGSSVIRDSVTSFPAADGHNGGIIRFGPDNRLYAVTGDADNASNAQMIGSRNGKVLRMTPSGNRPGSNPFAGSLTWSYGHRNSYGFTFDPNTNRLWQTENGPTCDDEVNYVRKGHNYGWGSGSSCPITSTEGPNPKGPEASWTPPIAITGAAFCKGCGIGSLEGSLLVGSHNDWEIRRLRLNAGRTGIVSDDVIYKHSTGVLSIERAPSGRLYYAASNGIFRLIRK